MQPAGFLKPTTRSVMRDFDIERSILGTGIEFNCLKTKRRRKKKKERKKERKKKKERKHLPAYSIDSASINSVYPFED
jgi:hypothetical protein